MISDPTLLKISTLLFACAVLHTFFTKQFNQWARKFPEGSARENLFHFLGEVEVVFGIWAALFVTLLAISQGTQTAVNYMNQVNYSEAVFVFVIMCLASTRPVMQAANLLIDTLARLLPLPAGVSFFLTALVIGPLLGSFITEPAAMTVVALMLRDRLFSQNISLKLRYAILGLLFVNISIGGTLTHFAAPPVLMVVNAWKWDLAYVFQNIGTRSLIAVLLGTLITAIVFWRELARLNISSAKESRKSVPLWLTLIHFGFMILTIVYHSHIAFVLPLFLLFMGIAEVTNEHQNPLKIRESLLVGFFLGGLVTLGGLQGWWLKDIVAALNSKALFLSATGLTAITDNAALTYLGTLVPNISDQAKLALVSGAVAGGGLTVIANAPNPAGYGILQKSFGEDGISPLGLLLAALPATLLAMFIYLISLP
ncbi:MAG: hypothetical protein FJY29_09955 [Betaproteobacteria bacterium]|nr:hypothetical protein [Betaproteobacteria bacterium]